MKIVALAAVAALAIGCADEDSFDNPERETGQQVINLNDTVVASVDRVDIGKTSVIRISGEIEPLNMWSRRVMYYHGMENELDTGFVVVGNPDGKLGEEDAIKAAANPNSCPPACMHCPEDYAFLCFASCF